MQSAPSCDDAAGKGNSSELVGAARQLLAARREKRASSTTSTGFVKGMATPSVTTAITAEQSLSVGSSSASSSPLVTPLSMSAASNEQSPSFAITERKIFVDPWHKKPGAAPFDDIKKPTGFTWLAVPTECPGIIYKVVNGRTIEALDLSEEGLMVLASLQLDSPALHLCCSNDAAMVACACADGSLQLFNVEPFQGFTFVWKVRSAHSHVMNDTVDSVDFNQGFSASSSVRSMSFSGHFILLVDALRYKVSVYHVTNPRNLVGGALDHIDIQCAEWGPQITERDKSFFVGDTSGVIHMLSLSDHNGIVLPKWQHAYRDEDGLPFACAHLHWQNTCQTLIAGFYRISENPLEDDDWHHTVLCVGVVHLEKGITADWDKVGHLPSISEAPGSCRPTLYTSEIVLPKANSVVLFSSNLSAGTRLIMKGDDNVWEVTALEYQNDVNDTTKTGVYSMGKALAQATTGNGLTPIGCLLAVSNDGTLSCFKLPSEEVLLLSCVDSPLGVSPNEMTYRSQGSAGRHSQMSVVAEKGCMEAYQVTRVRRFRSLNTQKIIHSEGVSNFNWLAVPSDSTGLAFRVLEGNTIQAVMITDSDVSHVTSVPTEGQIVLIACSSDGKAVAVAYEDANIILYHMKDNVLSKMRTITQDVNAAHDIRAMTFFDDLLLIVDSGVHKVCLYHTNGTDDRHQIDHISISCASWGCQDSVTMGIPLAIGDNMGNIRIYGVRLGCSMEARSIFTFPGKREGDGFVCTHLQFFNHGKQLFACFSRRKHFIEATMQGQVYEATTFVADVSIATCALYNWKQIGEVLGVQVDRQKRPSFTSSIVQGDDKNSRIVLGMPGSNVLYLYMEHNSAVWSWQAIRVPENRHSSSKVFSFGISWAYLGRDPCSSLLTILHVAPDGALYVVDVKPSLGMSNASLDRVENPFEWQQLQSTSLGFIAGSHAVSFQGEAMSTPKDLGSLSSGSARCGFRTNSLDRAPECMKTASPRHSFKPRALNYVLGDSNAAEATRKNPSSFTGLRADHEKLLHENSRLRAELKQAERVADEKLSAEMSRHSDTESQLHQLKESLKRRETEVLNLKSELTSAEEAGQKSEEALAILRIDLETMTVEMNAMSCIASMRAAEKDELKEKLKHLREVQRELEEKVVSLEEADMAKSAEIELLSALSTAERDNFQDRMKLLESNNSVLEKSFTALQENATDLEVILGQHQQKGEVEGVDSKRLFPDLQSVSTNVICKQPTLKAQIKKMLEEKDELSRHCKEALSIATQTIIESEKEGTDHIRSRHQDYTKEESLGHALLVAVGSLSTVATKCLAAQTDLSARYDMLQNESKEKLERLEKSITAHKTEEENLVNRLKEVQNAFQEKSSLCESNEKRFKSELTRIVQEKDEATTMAHQLEKEKLKLLEQLSTCSKDAEECRKAIHLKQALSQEELQRMQARLQACESEIASLTQINTEVHSKLTSSELDNSSLLSERQLLSASTEARISETKELRSMLKKIEKETEVERVSLEANLQASEDELKELRGKNLQLEDNLRDSSIENANLDSRVKDLEVKVQHDNERQKSSRSVFDVELKILHDRYVELQTAKECCDNERAKLSIEIAKLSALVTARQNEIDTLTFQLKEREELMRHESERFEAKLRTSDADLASLQESLSESEAAVTLVKEELQILKAQMDNVSDLAGKRMTQKEDAEAQVQGMESKLNSDAKRFDAELRMREVRLKALTEKLTNAEAGRTQLEFEKSKLENENDELRALASSRLSEVKKAEAQLQSIETRVQTDREQYMLKIKACEAQLEAVIRKEEEVRDKLVVVEGEKSTLSSECDRLSALVKMMLGEKEALEATIEALEAKIEEDESKHAKELNDREVEMQAIKQSMSGAHDETSRLLVQIERLNSSSKMTMKENEKLAARLQSLEVEIQADVDRYESEIRQWQVDFEKLKECERSMAAVRSQLEFGKSKLENENEELRALASSRLSEAMKAEAQLQSIETRAQTDREQYMLKVKACKAELEAVIRKEGEVRDKLVVVEGEKSTLSSECDRLSALVKMMLGEKEALEATIVALEAKIEEDESKYDKELNNRDAEWREVKQREQAMRLDACDKAFRERAENRLLSSRLEAVLTEKESLLAYVQTLEQNMKRALEDAESRSTARKKELKVGTEKRIHDVLKHEEMKKSHLLSEMDQLSSPRATFKKEANAGLLELQAQLADVSTKCQLCQSELVVSKMRHAEEEKRYDALKSERDTLLTDVERLTLLVNGNGNTSVRQQTMEGQHHHSGTNGIFKLRLQTSEDKQGSDTKLSLDKAESDIFSLVCSIKQICSSVRADLLCLLTLSDELSSPRSSYLSFLSTLGSILISGRTFNLKKKENLKLSLERTVIAFHDLMQLTSDSRCECCGKTFCSEFQTFSGRSPNEVDRRWDALEVSESPSPRASKGLRLGSKFHQTRFLKARVRLYHGKSENTKLPLSKRAFGKPRSSSVRLCFLLVCLVSFAVLLSLPTLSWVRTRPASSLRPTSNQLETGITRQNKCPECDGNDAEATDL